MTVRSAILLLVFNRPDTTAQVFELIRKARPARLYVSADGPRPDREGEAERCEAVRAIASAIDWPCELSTHFLDTNHGCKLAVTSGIDWFFTHEAEGIILEDDVAPTPDFFEFCDELLERYRDDDCIAAISGSNFVASRFSSPHSYFFSRYTHVWGWATWRRAWRHHDVTMSEWTEWNREGGMQRLFEQDFSAAFWRDMFDSVHLGRINSWAFPWLFACWQRNSLCVLPARNLTRNLGFGIDATHTTKTPRYVRDSPPGTLQLPLMHPTAIERNVVADQLIDRHVFGLSARGQLRSWLRGIWKRLPRFPQ